LGRTVFVDEAEIEVKGGDGGNGAASLRHEKFVPRGGPDGGDGARGGDVVAVANPHLRTLIDVTYRTHYQAEDGGGGGSSKRRGKTGADAIVKLPVGTVIREAEDGLLLADLAYGGQRVVLARGGRGGRGNAGFATATRRTPRFAEKGEPGEKRRLHLELKLLADVGVVGLPNVGKSSFIARVSAARPKIADYPFTTLVPNLGVVRMEEGSSFVIADLPGLVEGAHAGAGRGHDFLRHAERTHVFVHMLDAGADRDLLEDFATINRELELYRAEGPLSENLARRPQLVAFNKMDLLPPAEKLDRAEEEIRKRGYEVFRISALTGAGVMPLLGRAVQLLAETAAQPEELPPAEKPAPRPKRGLHVEKAGEGEFVVSGDDVERLLVMTDLDNEEAVRHLHRRLERMGVIGRLRGLGAKDGDRVKIGKIELDYVD
jgi:GTP-binding protein